MEQITHDIVKDLLPLYADDVVSDESKKMVEEHLANCTECKNYYDSLTDNSIPQESRKRIDDKNAIKKIKKAFTLKKLKVMFLSAVLVAAVSFGLFYGLVVRENYMSYDDSGLYVEDDTLKTDKNYYSYHGFTAPDSEIEFIYLTTTIYQSHRRNASTTEVLHLDPEATVTTEMDDDGNVIKEWNLKEIYYVPKEYAKKLNSQNYWSDDSSGSDWQEANKQKIDELKSIAAPVWKAK